MPSAFACHASRPARSELPFDWIAKSTIVVVPPCAAATVPVSKSSDAVVPPNGSPCACAQSMPPGMTYLPLASIVVVRRRRAACPARTSAAILPSSIQTSAANVSLAVTTVPSLISVLMLDLRSDFSLLSATFGAVPSCRALLRCCARERSRVSPSQGAVRVGAAVAEELPGPADLLDHVEVELGDDELVLVLAAAREDLAARVDEVLVP